MFGKFMDLFFGCWHKNYSFPITSRPGQKRSCASSPTGTYVVCLDCGREFPYDWQTMKVVPEGKESPAGLAEPVHTFAK